MMAPNSSWGRASEVDRGTSGRELTVLRDGAACRVRAHIVVEYDMADGGWHMKSGGSTSCSPRRNLSEGCTKQRVLVRPSIGTHYKGTHPATFGSVSVSPH